MLVAFVLLVGLPFYWFFINASTGNVAPQPLRIETLRRLAGQIEGEAPNGVHYEALAWREVQSNLLVAGTGLRERNFTVRAFQLTVADARPIQIDAGIAPDRKETQGYTAFDPAAQARVDRAIAATDKLVLLGDTAPHIGTLSAKARAQAILAGEEPRAIAPGVVTIPLRGLPGRAQMVYARLHDGREFLFAGDGALTKNAWMEVRPPARYRTDLNGKVDREMIASWLMTINALHREAPDMTVVPGQQPGLLDKWPQLRNGFQPPPQTGKKNAGQATGHKPRDNVLARRKS